MRSLIDRDRYVFLHNGSSGAENNTGIFIGSGGNKGPDEVSGPYLGPPVEFQKASELLTLRLVGAASAGKALG
ncbi:jg16486 [Pararge aegeria aegeria]|uniref:Jg16486 protein n=1 Tax=Pararge aegeria aegeria TaxID=348720 RepID=A0A8S4RH54_9NEOP|nr:jg16486 [Pararge aegeria aegeria]